MIKKFEILENEEDDFLSFSSDDLDSNFPKLEDCKSLWRFHGKIEDKHDHEKLKDCNIFALKDHEKESLSFSMFAPINEFGYTSEQTYKNFLNFVVRDIYGETQTEKIEKTIKKRNAIELLMERLLAYVQIPDSDFRRKLESITISPKEDQKYQPKANHWDVKYSSIEMEKDTVLQLTLIACCNFH